MCLYAKRLERGRFAGLWGEGNLREQTGSVSSEQRHVEAEAAEQKPKEPQNDHGPTPRCIMARP